MDSAGIIDPGFVGGPVRIDSSVANVSMDAGPAPIRRACHMTVFHRIVVDVIEMPREVRVVTDAVLPVTPLPDAPLTLVDPAGIALLQFGYPTGKTGFDQTPPRRKVDIARRRGPQQGWERMQVAATHRSYGKLWPSLDLDARCRSFSHSKGNTIFCKARTWRSILPTS